MTNVEYEYIIVDLNNPTILSDFSASINNPEEKLVNIYRQPNQNPTNGHIQVKTQQLMFLNPNNNYLMQVQNAVEQIKLGLQDYLRDYEDCEEEESIQEGGIQFMQVVEWDKMILPQHMNIVAITVNYPNAKGNCTGFLIACRLVLTCAHYFFYYNKETERQEIFDINSIELFPGACGQLKNPLKIKQIYIPQLFIEEKARELDFAVIKLTKAVQRDYYFPLMHSYQPQEQDEIGLYGYSNSALEYSNGSRHGPTAAQQEGSSIRHKKQQIKMESHYVRHNLPSSQGHSGSPLFVVGQQLPSVFGIHKGKRRYKNIKDIRRKEAIAITQKLIRSIMECFQQEEHQIISNIDPAEQMEQLIKMEKIVNNAYIEQAQQMQNQVLQEVLQEVPNQTVIQLLKQCLLEKCWLIVFGLIVAPFLVLLIYGIISLAFTYFRLQQSQKILFAKGQKYFNQQQYSKSEQYFLKILQIYNAADSQSNLKSEYNYQVTQQFYQIPTQNSQKILVYFYLGQIKTHQGSLEQAIYFFNRSVQIDPTLAIGYFRLANLLLRSQQIDKTNQFYQKACKLNSNELQVYKEVYKDMNATAQLKNMKQFLEIYLEMIKVYNQKAALIYLGVKLFQINKKDEAISCLRMAYTDQSVVIQFLIQVLASSQFQSKISKEANQKLDQHIYLSLGHAKFDEKSMDEAIKWYSKVRQLNSSHYLATYQLAKSHYSLGNLDLAIQYYQSALRMDANHRNYNPFAQFWYLLAEIDSQAQITQVLLGVIKINPTYSFGYFHLGWIYAMHDRNYQLIKKQFYPQVLRSDTNFLKIIIDSLKFYNHLDKYKKTLKIFKQNMQKNQTFTKNWQNAQQQLGCCCSNKNAICNPYHIFKKESSSANPFITTSSWQIQTLALQQINQQQNLYMMPTIRPIKRARLIGFVFSSNINSFFNGEILQRLLMHVDFDRLSSQSFNRLFIINFIPCHQQQDLHLHAISNQLTIYVDLCYYLDKKCQIWLSLLSYAIHHYIEISQRLKRKINLIIAEFNNSFVTSEQSY